VPREEGRLPIVLACDLADTDTVQVAVSATPGKTKHFQTLECEDITLCDCPGKCLSRGLCASKCQPFVRRSCVVPGLVFPSFVATQAEMVCNGILPIDQVTVGRQCTLECSQDLMQMRDYIGPAEVLVERVPRSVFEATYAFKLPAPGEEEDPNRGPTARELLCAYGKWRGYHTAHGSPDEPRSARYLLKDFARGKLLFCHPPPSYAGSADEYNADSHARAIPLGLDRATRNREAALKRRPAHDAIMEDMLAEDQVRTEWRRTRGGSHGYVCSDRRIVTKALTKQSTRVRAVYPSARPARLLPEA
jgi:large subunit GTPase 1